MNAKDVVKKFLPPLPGSLGDVQAQKLLDGLAAAGFAVVPLPKVAERQPSDAAEGWAFPGGEAVVWDHEPGLVSFEWDGREVSEFAPHEACDFAAALLAAARFAATSGTAS